MDSLEETDKLLIDMSLIKMKKTISGLMLVDSAASLTSKTGCSTLYLFKLVVFLALLILML